MSQPRRYVVDGHTGKLHREDVAGIAEASKDTGTTPIYEDALPGSASVSELELGERNETYLLTTCAKMEDPEILSVNLCAASSQDSPLTSPRMVEIDYRQLELQTLVSVAAFADSNWIRLTMVDNVGTFVTSFWTDRLTPVDQPCQQLKTTDYIAELAVLQAVTGQEMQSNMLVFVSSTTAVVALCPFLLTVDLQNAASYTWSETQCLEDMRSRSGSLRSYFNISVTDLVLGKFNDRVMDMSPTAALCLSTALNPLLDGTFCVTLHSDGSIRRWKIDMSVSPLPLEVRALNHSKVPPPSNWSDSRNAVSLCARTYDMTCAVSVHIKTDGFYTPSAEEEKDAEPFASQYCHLYVFYGNSQWTGDDSEDSCMTLNVPSEVNSLVSMSFSPTASRCSLSLLYESNDSGVVHINYPPSMMSIVSPEPQIMGHGFLDSVAQEERARIRALLFGPSLLDNMPEASVEEILHEMDSGYMKFLFRPMYPRGNGTVLPPSVGCIRRAMAKLVHGYSKKNTAGMSLELELVRTMYEWRNRDIRKAAAARTPRKSAAGPSPEKETAIVLADSFPSPTATPFSVYDALTHEIEDEDEGMDVDGTDEDDWDKIEQERSDQVEQHEMRWRRLLLQVWEEEQVTRIPLSVKWLSSHPEQVIVRAGVTTIMQKTSLTEQNTSSSWEKTLDDLAFKILRRIESDAKQASRLHAIEQQVSRSVSKAELAIQPPNDMYINDLTALSHWSVTGNLEISDEDHDTLENTLSDLTPPQLVEWIQSKPTNSAGGIPGLELVMMDNVVNSTSGKIASQRQVAGYQLRHAASALALQVFDSFRRLQLSRSLLLLFSGEGSQARDAALRAYLHTLAVLWTSSQRVPMPLTAFQSRKHVNLGTNFESTSPPSKRPSFGDDATSILSPTTSTMTTVIDVIAIELSQTMDHNSVVSNSPVGAAIFIARFLFGQAFSGSGKIPIGKPSLLPELGALPRPKDDSIATDYPRLALRLLTPYVAYPLTEDSSDIALARKESLAECLLIESHSSTVPTSLSSRMRQIACEMLVPNGPHFDSPTIQAAVEVTFTALQPRQDSTARLSIPKERLMDTLHDLLPNGTAIEISRLCELETIKNLFSPLATPGSHHDFGNEIKEALCIFAEIMLHISRVMFRLTILERHVSRRDSNDGGRSPDVTIGFISSAINDMAKTFPDEVCRAMPEYGKMWSRLFNHSIIAGEWKTAYSACIRNPRSELRNVSFQRLVRAMVDQGSLNELLVLCTELGQRIAMPSTLSSTEVRETVDLYEFASMVLAEAAARDVYSMRALSHDPSTLSDYQGSLYALHVSQKQWRRAAQSMDMRHVNAQKALDSRSSTIDFHSSEVRDGLIADDLVLASVGALNAMELVENDAHRFLISGEHGQYITIPVDIMDDEMSDPPTSSKRPRDPFTPEGEAKGKGDRLSNFMTTVELGGRAIRCIALRALYLDRSADPVLCKAALLRRIDSSKEDIDNLFNHGYFQYGLILAMAWAKNREADTGSRQPEGRDLFYDCLLHVLESYLIPLTLIGLQDSTRPSLDQLHMALDGIGTDIDAPSCVAARRNCDKAGLSVQALTEVSMLLIQKLTFSFSAANCPLAVDVASIVLESGVPSLPAWLEHFVLGSGDSSSNGLFAARPTAAVKRYLGDPAALLSLYTRHGLLSEACELVTSTLTSVDGQGRTREERAPSRLPEKGEIDYVPYKSIDLLWNLSDIVLSRGVLQPSDENRLENARVAMKTALEKHFALSEVSAAGMRSARALRN